MRPDQIVTKNNVVEPVQTELAQPMVVQIDIEAFWKELEPRVKDLVDRAIAAIKFPEVPKNVKPKEEKVDKQKDNSKEL